MQKLTSGYFYYRYSGNIIIPEKVTYNGVEYSVTSIGDDAFYDCSSLTSIEIPNSVTSIGDDAFLRCSSLTSITIPNSVTSIGEGAFFICSSLTSIDVDENNLNYASIDGVLYDKNKTTLICCPGGKTEILIFDGVTKIGELAFYECSLLKSIKIPNSVTSIGYEAFLYCSSLTSINIPQSVTFIEEPMETHIFGGCSLLSQIEVDVNNSNYSSVDGVLYDKNIKTLIICPPAKNSINIPNSVISIGEFAFFECSSLISITIPNSVTEIGARAFYGCSSFTSIEIQAENPLTIDEYTF